MKTSLITLAFALVSSIVLAQTTTENYVKTTTYQVETTDGQNKTGTSTPVTKNDKTESITYLDGLGRPKQSITKQVGGNREDIISHIEYDSITGRQLKNYLPYSRNNSSLDYELPSVIITALKNQYLAKYPTELDATTPNHYSETLFEASPLSRVLEQGAPGQDWALDKVNDTDHTIKFDYQTNLINEVKLYSVSHPNNDTEKADLAYNGHYQVNELYKTITKDENWQPNQTNQTNQKDHTTEEFKNTQGQVVLKRTYNNSKHDTYYVYDNFGNLTFVLSPEGSENILDVNENVVQSILDDLCYQYHYDYRNRLIEKKIPQKGWEYIIYDKLDRPILTQDANLGLDNKWLFTKYDEFDRVAYTGFLDSSDSRSTLQTVVNNFSTLSESRKLTAATINGTEIYYNNAAYPTSNISEILTINYYDDYNWDTNQTFEASYNLTYNGLDKEGNIYTKNVGSSWGNSGFLTTATIQGDGYIQWTANTNNKELVIGLSKTNSALDDHYNTIDYGIYLKWNGSLRISEEGVNIQIPTIWYSIGDEFRVERSLDQIIYYKNDIAFHSSATPSTGTLIGDGSFLNYTGQVEDVFIGYSSLGQPFTSSTKGLATGSKVRILDTNQWTTSSSYYDEKGRSVYSISKNNYLNIIDAVSSYFDFTGKVIKSHSTHNNKSNKSVIVTGDEFRYDHTGRLLRHEQKINNDDKELIAKNNYDELGQLKQKLIGGSLPSLSNYTNVQGVVLSSNNITKNVGSAWFNAGVSTIENISGDGFVSFSTTNSAATGVLACGLSYTDPNVNWTSIDYGLMIQANSQVSVRESGVDRGFKTSHVPGDVFSVERRGTTIYYLKNGSTFYVSEIQTTLAPMIGDLTIYHNGATVKDLVVVDLENELQEVDYTYNIRGWLKTINDITGLSVSGSPTDLFGFKLNYNTNDLDGGVALYNGNISESLWNTTSIDPGTSETNIRRGYNYSYDALNRIESANFHKLSGVYQNNYYNLSNVSYDRNGNIHNLARSGLDNSGELLENMDELTYEYNGNQLNDILEDGNHSYGFKDVGNIQTIDYKYDANGNMTDDFNKDIIITYNHLNLPASVTKSGAVITYTYDATGIKLSKSLVDGGSTTITDYANNFIYKNSNLEFFSHPEGYVHYNNSNKSYEYVYQYKDHLGNIRLAYSDGDSNGSISNSEIIEENNYYPFGLKHKGYNNNVSANSNGSARKFGFNGKEEQDELGLGWHDFSARNYDASIGRWMNLDPLAEQMRRHSPYNYAYDNPVYFIDPDGMKPYGGNPFLVKLVQRAMRKTLTKTKNTLLDNRKTFQNLVDEHRAKIKEFKKDPIGNSGEEWLKTATKDNPDSKTLMERAMGRVGELESQIKKHQINIDKIDVKIEGIDKELKSLADDAVKTTTLATGATINTANTEDDCGESCSEESSSESFTGNDTLDSIFKNVSEFYSTTENIGAKSLGKDSNVGKVVDDLNPLNLGISGLFKWLINK